MMFVGVLFLCYVDVLLCVLTVSCDCGCLVCFYFGLAFGFLLFDVGWLGWLVFSLCTVILFSFGVLLTCMVVFGLSVLW